MRQTGVSSTRNFRKCGSEQHGGIFGINFLGVLVFEYLHLSGEQDKVTLEIIEKDNVTELNSKINGDVSVLSLFSIHDHGHDSNQTIFIKYEYGDVIWRLSSLMPFMHIAILFEIFHKKYNFHQVKLKNKESKSLIVNPNNSKPVRQIKIPDITMGDDFFKFNKKFSFNAMGLHNK